jgi:anti-sigma factor RsiW
MKPIDPRVHRLLDGELPAHEEAQLRAELQGAPDARLDLELFSLAQPSPRRAGAALPAGFERQVMARVAARPAPRPSLLARIFSFGFSAGYPLQGAGALAGVAVALLGVGLFAGYHVGASRGRAPEVAVAVAAADSAPQKTLVRFALRAPEARRVELVGSFNGWGSEGIALNRGSDENWVASVELQRGKYEYTFVIDGERWVPDPAAGQLVDDGFGGHNAVIEL